MIANEIVGFSILFYFLCLVSITGLSRTLIGGHWFVKERQLEQQVVSPLSIYISRFQ